MTAGLRRRPRHVLQLVQRVRHSPAARDLRRLPGRAATYLARVVGGRLAARAPMLLAAVVVGALIAALVALENSWPSDSLGVAR